ncbi:hypothetical protein D5085_18225 [Ectothiorhodospiraceae bacterium BW-2]|nr:hypothetical protein D5085_18225 [Ectothiorhodospiraceae bacterium BW-2]
MQHRNRNRVATAVVATVMTALFGCAGLTIDDIDAWQPVNLPLAELAPTEAQLARSQQKIRVVSSGFTLSQPSALAQQSQVVATLSARLEQHLTGAGVQLIDRHQAQKLLSELALAEATGRSGSYQGPEVADFAVMGRIDSIETGSQFAKSYERKTKQGSERVPAKCTYQATVKATLQIFSIPELQMVERIALSGSETMEEESQHCSSANGKYSALVARAGEESLDSGRVELQNRFAASSYVVDMRSDGEEYLIKIMIGRQRHISKGDKIEIIRLRQEGNRLTQKVTLVERGIGSATVTDQIGADYSWALVDKAEEARRIQLGDYVKVRFDRSFMESLLSW